MALKLSKIGCILILVDIDEDGLSKTGKEIGKENSKIHFYNCDVSKLESVQKLSKVIEKDIGNVTILINNAGIVHGKKFLETSEEDNRKILDSNTFAHFWTTKTFLPNMISKNQGHLVTISSVAGISGGSDLADYCASKFAVYGFHESIRLDLKKSAVRYILLIFSQM